MSDDSTRQISDQAAARRQARRMAAVFAGVSVAFAAADGSLFPVAGWAALAVLGVWFAVGVVRVERLCRKPVNRRAVTRVAVAHYTPALLVAVVLPLAATTGLLA